MRSLDCSVCLQDIEEYYDTTVNIIDHNQRLVSMAADNPHGARLLSSGRVVILRDLVSKRRFVGRFDRGPEELTKIPQHFNFHVGVLLKPSPGRASGGAKMYWVLAVVDSHTKSGKNGETVNADQCCPNAHDRRPARSAFLLYRIPLTLA